jgi:hypothetical protein
VDGTSGAPIAASGGTCSIRVNASSVPVGPNGVAGDGDDTFPSAGNCLLWGPPDVVGAQHLASTSAVAGSHSANQTLFHELCTATFDEGTGTQTDFERGERYAGRPLGGLNIAAVELAGRWN